MKHIVITIGREYGSGGRFIGKKLAEALNIPFYDKEIIEKVASEGHFSKEFVEKNDEKPNGIINALYISQNYTLPLNQQVFLAQFSVIREMAKKESCVIIGRCADYILADRTDTVNVFVHAPIEKRIERVVKYYGVEEAKAQDTIKKVDKSRAKYYNFFADKEWGKAKGYHLCLDSSIGIDETVNVIKAYVEGFNK